jgi:hypothetical protein
VSSVTCAERAKVESASKSLLHGPFGYKDTIKRANSKIKADEIHHPLGK